MFRQSATAGVPAALWLLVVVATTTIITQPAAAYSTGAGRCVTGEPAPLHGNNQVSGAIHDAFMALTVGRTEVFDGDKLIIPAGSPVDISISSADPYKGILFQVGQLPDVIVQDYDESLQLAFGMDCVGRAAVTHADASPKFMSQITIQLDEAVETTLDVNIVLDQATFFHSQVTLNVVGAPKKPATAAPGIPGDVPQDAFLVEDNTPSPASAMMTLVPDGTATTKPLETTLIDGTKEPVVTLPDGSTGGGGGGGTVTFVPDRTKTHEPAEAFLIGTTEPIMDDIPTEPPGMEDDESSGGTFVPDRIGTEEPLDGSLVDGNNNTSSAPFSVPDLTEPPVAAPVLPANTMVSIVDVLNSRSHLSLVANAVMVAGLDSTFNSMDSLTFFAPYNDAFDGAPFVDRWLAEAEDDDEANDSNDWKWHWRTLLTFHMVNDLVYTRDLAPGGALKTMMTPPQDILIMDGMLEEIGADIALMGDKMQQRGSNIIQGNVEAVMGLVHVVDYPIMPTWLTVTINEYLVGQSEQSTLVDLIVKTGLEDTLQNEAVTLLAPDPDVLDEVVSYYNFTDDEWSKIMQVHIIPGVWYTEKMTDGLKLTNIGGSDLQVTLEDDVVSVFPALKIQGASLKMPDVLTNNGLIHVMAQVMIPADMLPTDPPSSAPSDMPTDPPSSAPSDMPSPVPTSSPTPEPTPEPTKAPTPSPTSTPTAEPTSEPTKAPTPGPTSTPTAGPTSEPTKAPTPGPTSSPTPEPTSEPTKAPTPSPTISDPPSPVPSDMPSPVPTFSPTPGPTPGPTNEPTPGPTPSPTPGPTPEPTNEPTPGPTPSPTPEPGVEEILDIDFDLSALVDALRMANMVDILNGDGTFTIFAPVDSAFDALPSELQDLLTQPDWIVHLRMLLGNHVIDGQVLMSTMIRNAMTAVTSSGESITASVDDGLGIVSFSGDAFDDSIIVEADITAGTGVAHKVDQVFLPSSLTQNLFQVMAVSMGDSLRYPVEAFLSFVTKAGMESAVSADAITLFVPTNDAFDAMSTADQTLLLNNPAAAKSLVEQHMVSRVWAAEKLADGLEIVSVAGGTLPVTISDDNTRVGDATILQADVVARNGLMHIIDTVLFSPLLVESDGVNEVDEETTTTTVTPAASPGSNTANLVDALPSLTPTASPLLEPTASPIMASPSLAPTASPTRVLKCSFDEIMQVALPGVPEGLMMKHFVDTDAGTISFQLMYGGQGWIGIGFSDDGKMVGSTAVIGLPDANTVDFYSLDGYAESSVAPSSDEISLSNASITQTDMATILTFTRSISKNDGLEAKVGASARLIYAVGATNQLSYHMARSSIGISFASC